MKSQSSNYSQNREELLAHLRDQIEFMIVSAVSFDNGFEGEAKRLAATIRILVHNTPRSTALLTQLRKTDILFYDSASAFDLKNIATSNCLTMFRQSPSGWDYVAPLDNLSPARSKDKKVGFARWWDRTIIYKDNAGNEFTRKNLVLAVANKEGGAHIDPKLDSAYANLSRFNSLGWKVYANGEEKDFNNSPVLPSVRQIAHEVIKSLRDECSTLFLSNDSIWSRFSQYDEHCRAVKHSGVLFDNPILQLSDPN